MIATFLIFRPPVRRPDVEGFARGAIPGQPERNAHEPPRTSSGGAAGRRARYPELDLAVAELYAGEHMPNAAIWISFAGAWLASEYLLRFWPANGWALSDIALRIIHSIRTAAPWIMLWKTGEIAISGWLTE